MLYNNSDEKSIDDLNDFNNPIKKLENLTSLKPNENDTF